MDQKFRVYFKIVVSVMYWIEDVHSTKINVPQPINDH